MFEEQFPFHGVLDFGLLGSELWVEVGYFVGSFIRIVLKPKIVDEHFM